MFISKKIGLYAVLFSLYIVVSSSIVLAVNKKDAPLNIFGTTKIVAEDIFTLVETKPDLIIIDARMRTDRIQGYLEGSISLPDTETDCSSLKKIIPTKKSSVLFYCNGVKCGRSVKSSKRALQCGYSNIYWFRGGFEEWKSKNLPYLKK